MKQICVYLLLLGCIFSLPTLNRTGFAREITAPVPLDQASGMPDSEEGTHTSKDLHTSVLSTKNRQNPCRQAKIPGLVADCDYSQSYTPTRQATVPVRPSYYAFLSRYCLF